MIDETGKKSAIFMLTWLIFTGLVTYVLQLHIITHHVMVDTSQASYSTYIGVYYTVISAITRLGMLTVLLEYINSFQSQWQHKAKTACPWPYPYHSPSIVIVLHIALIAN